MATHYILHNYLTSASSNLWTLDITTFKRRLGGAPGLFSWLSVQPLIRLRSWSQGLIKYQALFFSQMSLDLRKFSSNITPYHDSNITVSKMAKTVFSCTRRKIMEFVKTALFLLYYFSIYVQWRLRLCISWWSLHHQCLEKGYNKKQYFRISKYQL